MPTNPAEPSAPSRALRPLDGGRTPGHWCQPPPSSSAVDFISQFAPAVRSQWIARTGLPDTSIRQTIRGGTSWFVEHAAQAFIDQRAQRPPCLPRVPFGPLQKCVRQFHSGLHAIHLTHINGYGQYGMLVPTTTFDQP